MSKSFHSLSSRRRAALWGWARPGVRCAQPTRTFGLCDFFPEFFFACDAHARVYIYNMASAFAFFPVLRVRCQAVFSGHGPSYLGWRGSPSSWRFCGKRKESLPTIGCREKTLPSIGPGSIWLLGMLVWPFRMKSGIPVQSITITSRGSLWVAWDASGQKVFSWARGGGQLFGVHEEDVQLSSCAPCIVLGIARRAEL